jgi:hypothetical protein
MPDFSDRNPAGDFARFQRATVLGSVRDREAVGGDLGLRAGGGLPVTGTMSAFSALMSALTKRGRIWGLRAHMEAAFPFARAPLPPFFSSCAPSLSMCARFCRGRTWCQAHFLGVTSNRPRWVRSRRGSILSASGLGFGGLATAVSVAGHDESQMKTAPPHAQFGPATFGMFLAHEGTVPVVGGEVAIRGDGRQTSFARRLSATGS